MPNAHFIEFCFSERYEVNVVAESNAALFTPDLHLPTSGPHDLVGRLDTQGREVSISIG